MLKNIHIKTIIIFAIIGIFIITGLGIYNVKYIESIISMQLNQEIINNSIKQVITTTVVLDVFYAFVCLIIGVIVSRIINKPIVKLLKDANKVISSNKKDLKNKNNDEIVDTFSIMTDELKENLNEMSKQKRQIETIILHMTDGIIAFDMDGNVILINNAAKQLLQLSDRDNNFKTIFNKKLNIDINMEKII